MIAEDAIQKVKEQNDIVDVISESVKLKRTGRNYMGLCPFHNEKSPSFSVSQDKQIYRCFGCGEAGNVISFVMKIRNLTFPEAVKVLAQRANIEIDVESKENKAKKEKYDKMYAINVEAARYFFSNLNTNKNGKDYFLRRGILETTIRRFGLGFSIDKWDGLILHLKKKGYSDLDMLEAGLIIKSQNGKYYDRFRNRVMFPVFDYRGKVIGFGGRVLDDSKPKYLNSPETSLFKKGIHLYGLNFAIKENKDRTIIIVEGYMDCISLHQYGITNVVASLGTALTVNQGKLLKRYADKVIISYDADFAGQTATLRGLEILKKEGFDVRVLTVPQGKDPDDYIRSNGTESFKKLIEEALPLIDYRLKKAAEGINFNNREMTIQYAKNITEIIADLDPIEKDVYIKKVSEETGIKEQALYDLLSDKIQKNSNKLQNMNNQEDFGQKLYLEPDYIKDERTLLYFMLKDKNICEYVIGNVDESQLILEAHKKIFNLLVQYKDLQESDKVGKIDINCNDSESAKEWINIIELNFTQKEYDIKKLINDCIREIKKFKLEESKREIMIKIKQYETKGLLEESMKLAVKLMEIQKELGNI